MPLGHGFRWQKVRGLAAFARDLRATLSKSIIKAGGSLSCRFARAEMKVFRREPVRKAASGLHAYRKMHIIEAGQDCPIAP